MAVKYLLLDDGTKFYQRDGKLSPYTKGKQGQTLYWLADGHWAIGERKLFQLGTSKLIQTSIELFAAEKNKNTASGYKFVFQYNFSSWEEAQKVLPAIVKDTRKANSDKTKTLLTALATRQGDELFQGEPIDLKYIKGRPTD